MSVIFRSKADLPTAFGAFTIHVFDEGAVSHVALVAGTLSNDCLVRVHSECLTGDVLRSRRCDCGEQVELAMQKIQAAGSGVLIYLGGQEGRGIGLANKIKAYALQDKGSDTVDANIELGLPVDERSYGAAAEILKLFGLHKITLMTNNPAKISGLEIHGIKVTSREALWAAINPANAAYLKTKQAKMGHFAPLSAEKP